MTSDRCLAWHDGHTCDHATNCRRAMLNLLARTAYKPTEPAPTDRRTIRNTETPE